MTEKVEKVKKKKKGYFDNEEMLMWLRKRNAIKEVMLTEFIDESIPDSTEVKAVLYQISDSQIVFEDKIYTSETLAKVYDRVNNEVGKLYVKVAEGMMKRPNFINYPPDQKTEMISDALYFMTRAGERYDVNYPNPFAYFSQITFNSFLQSIKNMKKRITTFVCVDHLENFDNFED